MPNTGRTILVVDDEEKVRLLLRRCLESDGYQVLEAADEREMNAALESNDVSLVTLDLNLGGENGIKLATAIRAKTNIPIIIVSGKGDVIDRIVGLEVGADDYITKPFHIREVLARVRTVLRRVDERIVKLDAMPASVDEQLHFGGFTVRPERMELIDPLGTPRELTSGDFKLLMIFLERPKRVLTRDQLMDLMAGRDWNPLDRTIDNQIARLRKRIEADPSNPLYIKTVRGVGYTFATDVRSQ